MDYLESLGKQLSELTTYDLKKAYADAKAMVLNLSEAEKLVDEATSNESWGASSTLMQQIAQGEQHVQLPTIQRDNAGHVRKDHTYESPRLSVNSYKRFTDLDARQWRQVYKALTLLEYIVKNGSERVVDDARQHLSLIKILRNFHYIDEKGKDQGINVRNRSKELAELLQDLERVRQERRKAKSNRNKYGGIGNEGSRYGGFGSESFGRDGGSSTVDSYSGGSSSFRDTSARHDEYDEYDAGDDEDRPSRPSSSRKVASTMRDDVSAPPLKKKEPEVNLFDLDDEEQAPAPAVAPAVAAQANSFGADDDFDDFQAAAPTAPVAKPAAFSAAPIAPSATTTATSKPNFFDMVSAAPGSTNAFKPSPLSPMGGMSSPPLSPPGPPRYGMMSNQSATPQQPRYGAQAPVSSPPLGGAGFSAAAPKAAGSGGFDDLWDLAGGSSASAKAKTAAQPANAGQTMASLAQQRLWAGSSAVPKPAAQANGGRSSDFDLLM